MYVTRYYIHSKAEEWYNNKIKEKMENVFNTQYDLNTFYRWGREISHQARIRPKKYLKLALYLINCFIIILIRFTSWNNLVIVFCIYILCFKKSGTFEKFGFFQLTLNNLKKKKNNFKTFYALWYCLKIILHVYTMY